MRSRLEHFLDPDIGLVDPAEVAFIIIEPFQGEGGDNIPSLDFMKEVGRLAKKYSIPLISDEIQAGMGRTGNGGPSNISASNPTSSRWPNRCASALP